MRNGTSGFTLLEMIIVVTVLGVVTLILSERYTSSTASRFKSEQIKQVNALVSQEILQVWKSTGVQANTLATNPLLITGNSWLDIVMFGDEYVSAEYQSFYKNHISTGVGELIQVEAPPSEGIPGRYTVLGYTFKIDPRTDSGITFTYETVDIQLIDFVSKKYQEPEYDATTKQDFAGVVQYTQNNDLKLVLGAML